MSRLSAASLLAAVLFSASACAVRQEYRLVPAGPQTRLELREDIAPVAADPQHRLLVRVRDGGPVEVRLSAPPVCRRTEVLQTGQVRLEERTLQTGDKLAMWAGYAGAAAVAGLVGTGMAKGGDPATGSKIFAVFGLPFAALGVAESLRARDRETPAEPLSETVVRESEPCGEAPEGWPVVARNGITSATVNAGTAWKAVDAASAPGILPAGYDSFAGTAEASWPVRPEGNGLFAEADGTLAGAIAQRAAETRAAKTADLTPRSEPVTQPVAAPARMAKTDAPAAPIPVAAVQTAPAPETQAEPAPEPEPAQSDTEPAPEPAPAPVMAAAAQPAPAQTAEPESAPEPAPAPKAAAEEAPVPEPVAQDKENACPPTRVTEAGVLPEAFFTQPVRMRTVVERDWLSRISRALFGNPMEYRVLYQLNGDLIQDPDRIYPGQQLRVPVEPRTLESWLEEVPPACRNAR